MSLYIFERLARKIYTYCALLGMQIKMVNNLKDVDFAIECMHLCALCNYEQVALINDAILFKWY